jgi:hypothetical protein
VRELGVSVMWPKLEEPEWSTFRFPRRDKDWQVGETVRIVFHPRGRDRKVLGTAQVRDKQPRVMIADEGPIMSTSPDEAREDGFNSLSMMCAWIRQRYGEESLHKPMNKLTIRWQQ